MRILVLPHIVLMLENISLDALSIKILVDTIGSDRAYDSVVIDVRLSVDIAVELASFELIA